MGIPQLKFRLLLSSGKNTDCLGFKVEISIQNLKKNNFLWENIYPHPLQKQKKKTNLHYQNSFYRNYSFF